MESEHDKYIREVAYKYRIQPCEHVTKCYPDGITKEQLLDCHRCTEYEPTTRVTAEESIVMTLAVMEHPELHDMPREQKIQLLDTLLKILRGKV